MILTKKNKEKIKEHAFRENPRECCGLIISKGHHADVFPCNNISSLPEVNFKVSPRDYAKFSNYGKIEAVYHSHPSGKTGFSLLDQQSYFTNKERFILYNIENDKFFDSLEEENSEFLGRSFKRGVKDCMRITTDYYTSKFNVKLEYDEIWPNDEYYLNKDKKINVEKVIERVRYSPSIILNPTPSSFGGNKTTFAWLYINFSVAKNKDPKEHDLIVFEAKPEEPWPCHLAICVGHGKALIQPVNKKSCICDYEEVLKKKTLMIFRPNFINE